jgi:hypothetical protein
VRPDRRDNNVSHPPADAERSWALQQSTVEAAWANVTATRANVVATSLLGAFTLYLLFGTMRATRHAAEAALKSAIVAEHAERAWLLPTGQGELRCHVTPDVHDMMNQPALLPQLRLVVSNFGKTPAFEIVNVRSNWEVRFEDDPLPDTLAYDKPGGHGAINVLAPRVQFVWHTALTGGSDMFRHFTDGIRGLRLYIYGELTYRDTFRVNGEPYFTEYCLYAKEPNTTTLFVATTHNTAR